MPSVGKDVEQLELSQASIEVYGSMCCYNYFAEMFQYTLKQNIFMPVI